jgi:hypothetical protein
MRKPASPLIPFTAAAVAAVVGLFWSGEITPSKNSGLITEAQAIIGRPLTPMSYAGVARRTVRRAPYYAMPPVVVAPVVVAPVVVAPACARVVNAYGQIMTICR